MNSADIVNLVHFDVQPLMDPGRDAQGCLNGSSGNNDRVASAGAGVRHQAEQLSVKLIYVESVAVTESLEDVTSGARAFVRKATVVVDIVRGEALTVTASRSLILEVAGQWKTQV